MKFKKTLAVACVFAALAATASFAFATPQQAAADDDRWYGITLTNVDTEKLTLKKGASYSIGAKSSVEEKLSYRSSKKKVATVSKSGKIRARRIGKAVITVRGKKSGYSRTIKLGVVKKSKYRKPSNIKLEVYEKTLTVSSVIKKSDGLLRTTLKARKGKPSNKNVIYSSSNKSVLSVKPDGVVIAKKPGVARVKVKAADAPKCKTSVKVKVIKTSPESDFRYVVKNGEYGYGAYITSYAYKNTGPSDGYYVYGFNRAIVLPAKLAGVNVVSAKIQSSLDTNNDFDVVASSCPTLVNLEVHPDNVYRISCDRNPSLKRLVAGSSEGSWFACVDVDLSGVPNLEELSIKGGFDSHVPDFSSLPKLKRLILRHCGLSKLDISAATQLEELDCSYNYLTSLDVSANVHLTKLICSYNDFGADLSSLGSLAALRAWAAQPGHIAVLDPQGHYWD